MEKLKYGIIDVGGGVRDVFGAGVLEGCMEKGLSFDVCLGVSAGSGNLTSFLAGQKGRNYRFYSDFCFRKQYIGFGNFLKNRNYVNLDYAYSVLSDRNGECPLDMEKVLENPAEFYVVTCDAKTAVAVYFDKNGLKEYGLDVIKASSSLPVVNTPYPVGKGLYFDGGLADPIPLEKAFSLGCDKVVIILSRPRDFFRVPKKDAMFAKLIRRKYPKASKALAMRYRKYNESLLIAQKYEKEGRVRIIAPTDCYGMSTLTRDKEKIARLYEDGKKAAEKAEEFLTTSASQTFVPYCE